MDYQNKEGSTGRVVDRVFIPFTSQADADGKPEKAEKREPAKEPAKK